MVVTFVYVIAVETVYNTLNLERCKKQMQQQTALFLFKNAIKHFFVFFLKSASFNFSATFLEHCERQAMVKLVCLAYVYIEKLWKAVQWSQKCILCERPLRKSKRPYTECVFAFKNVIRKAPE